MHKRKVDKKNPRSPHPLILPREPLAMAAGQGLRQTVGSWRDPRWWLPSSRPGLTHRLREGGVFLGAPDMEGAKGAAIKTAQMGTEPGKGVICGQVRGETLPDPVLTLLILILTAL